MLCFYLHAYGGMQVYNIEQQHSGEPTVSTWGYMQTGRFWFESFQNWQSEFVSIISMVLLSIFLRQKGSPNQSPYMPRIAKPANRSKIMAHDHAYWLAVIIWYKTREKHPPYK